MDQFSSTPKKYTEQTGSTTQFSRFGRSLTQVVRGKGKSYIPINSRNIRKNSELTFYTPSPNVKTNTNCS